MEKQLTIEDLHPGMKFKALGEGGRMYTLIWDERCKATPRKGRLKLKREMDGLVLNFSTGTFFDMIQTGKVKQEEHSEQTS